MESEIKHLASYLCVACEKIVVPPEANVPSVMIDNGLQVKGLSTVVKLLVKRSQKAELLGQTKEEQALVNQWLEYRVNQVDRCSDEKDTTTVLQELNNYLCDRVFLAGFRFTVADLVLYIGLHNMVSDLPFYKKQKFIHLSRWFDHVQHLPNARQNLSSVFFQKNFIYTDSSH